MHKAYKTAKNEVHYDWEWVEFEDNNETPRKIAIRLPVEYIKFTYPSGEHTYMPMSELLANGLGGLSFGTATEAIKIERGA